MPRYQITPNGQITDEGKAIGWVEGGTNLIFKEGVEISGQARAYLERLLKPEEGKPPVEDFEEEDTKASQNRTQSDATRSDVPPAPEMDPRLGDKTPAYMQWLRTHFPEEYAKRYKGRKVSDTPGPLYGGGDIPEEQIWKDNPEVWFKPQK